MHNIKIGYNKVINLLGKPNEYKIPKFTTIKWIEIFDQSNGTYNKNKDIRFKTNQLRNDLCDFNDAYIVAIGKATATDPNPDDDNINYDRTIVLKNAGPSFTCVLKINNQLIEDAQDLDIVMPMYNLLIIPKMLEKQLDPFGIMNYYPNIPDSEHAGNNERKRIFYPISSGYSQSFNYKTKLVGTLPDEDDELENIKIVVPLKNRSNFMFNLDFLMINAEMELILKWTEDCVLTEKATKRSKAFNTSSSWQCRSACCSCSQCTI